LDAVLSRTRCRNFATLASNQQSSVPNLKFAIVNKVFGILWSMVISDWKWPEKSSLHLASTLIGFLPKNYPAASEVGIVGSPARVLRGRWDRDRLTTKCTSCVIRCAVPGRCRQRITNMQQSALEDIMGLAVRFSRPVILQCRDYGPGEVSRLVLESITCLEFQNLKYHNIASSDHVMKWRSGTQFVLSEVFFGFTTNFIGQVTVEQAVTRCPLERILLILRICPLSRNNKPWMCHGTSCQWQKQWHGWKTYLLLWS